MTAVAAAFPRAFAVRFRELYRWDPSSFHRILWHWPADVLRPLGSGLRARKEKVNRTKLKFSDLQPITIHFDGSIDRRRVDADREYTMDLFAAKPGGIVVAKIDLKNGAVGIVPEGWDKVVVTGHFSVYEPVRSKLPPEYLHLLIQTEFFKAHLWRNKVGAEGRKEVKLDFFEAERIPFPPLPVQHEIVAAWESAQRVAAETDAKTERLEHEIEAGFLADLGLKARVQATMPRVFSVQWRDFLRWGVRHNQLARSGTDLTRGKYPAVSLGPCLQMVQYGSSEKANTAGRGTPILRINNVKGGTVDTADLKYLELGHQARRGLLLADGDILVIRTSGSRDLVVSSAVFHERGDYVFTSYLIRLRPDPMKADPDYIATFLNSSLVRQQVDATSRQIMQNNINSEELRSLQIPMPPLATQYMIMKRVDAGRAEVAKLNADAKARAEAAKADVKSMILGTKKVGAP